MSGFVQLGAKKQKVSEIGNGDFQSHRKRENNANMELCSAALRALCSIILYGGSLIKEDSHRRLQELSIPLLIRLQQGPDQWIGPYTNSECRKQLYRLLLSLTLTPSPRLPPPLHCAIRIFRLGLTEENLQVSMFCTEALAICRVIIHPRVPTLQRPLPQHTPRPPLQVDPPAQRPPAPQLTFPTTIPVNHLPIRTPVPLQPSEPPAPPLIPSPQETFGGKTPRPMFIHYEKEETSDVEISLESDSDDSVVIVPEGLLQKPTTNSEPSPPSAKPPAEEPPAAEVTAQPAVPSPTTVAAAPAPPPACPGPSPTQTPGAAEAPPPPPAPAPPEGDMVININSTDEEDEEEDEDEEGMYDDEEDEYYDEEEEEEDLEGLDEDEEEEFEDDEGLTEEEEDEEDLDAEAEEEEDEGEDDEGIMDPEEVRIAANLDDLPESDHPVTSEPDEGPPRLSPVQEDDNGDTDLLMLVESEDRESPVETGQDGLSDTEVMDHHSPPPVLSPPPAPRLQEEDDETAVPDETESDAIPEPPLLEDEPVKEEKKPLKPHVVVEEEEALDEAEDELPDAESMLADFIDCPPDDDKDSEPRST
ncbi:hypothetical protein GDO81_019950 [Engystomops pustulosus]|uniref:PELP1 middle domain-containing protein n=1 Tax=Engystomops pustulosus TaxID=76066 RepID=A0AAV6ZIF7_ENGPU|nr:hypothetical protein GDO81_019950 [Engystomops pustulosus]